MRKAILILTLILILIPNILFAKSNNYIPLLKKYFKSEWRTAYAIMMAESGGNPKAIGDTHLKYYSYGLFQINRRWHKYPKEKLLEPEFNIKIAKKIYDERGWKEWGAYKNGSCERWLRRIIREEEKNEHNRNTQKESRGN